MRFVLHRTVESLREWSACCDGRIEPGERKAPRGQRIHMRIQTVIGILLVVVGLLALALGAITYTRREDVLDVGPVGVTTEKHERIPLPPVLGIVSVIGGVGILVAGSRRR